MACSCNPADFKDRTKQNKTREKQSVLWSVLFPANQHNPKQNIGRQQGLLLFLMEFQSKWPITEWNSNLATSSQSFSLSNNCTTKYHIIHAHAHMHKAFVWENTNYFLKFYLNRAKVNKQLQRGRVWMNHPLIITLFYWKLINSWTYSKIISVTKAIFPQRHPSIWLLWCV